MSLITIFVILIVELVEQIKLIQLVRLLKLCFTNPATIKLSGLCRHKVQKSFTNLIKKNSDSMSRSHVEKKKKQSAGSAGASSPTLNI